MDLQEPSPLADDAHARLPAERERYSLDPFFSPRSVAVIGATETRGSVGRTILWNLISSPFGGTVYPVNPKRSNVLGIKAFPSIAGVPERVDLAVVATPAATVPGVIAQCAEHGVKAAVIISAGFKELGSSGVELERQVLEHARRGGMRLIGPNCLGVMNPVTGVNATFAAGMARPGNVAFLSQSGALLTAILDWSVKELVGFSAIVSTGSMLDVGWGDLIDHFGNDPQTRSILIYMESIGDARAFLSAAREVTLSKPIIVIKAGRTEAAARAAASHTGSLTGSDEVLNAAFRRSGVLRVQNIADLFYMAEVLAKQPRPKGPRLTIVTNAGGPAVLATDALIDAGGELAPLADTSRAALDDILPPHWSRNNPIDILGDASADRYARTLEVVAKDQASDGLLVILTPQDMTDPTQTAEALARHARTEGKPVLASWIGGPAVQSGEAILNRAGVPTFSFPDTAARAFHYMWRYTYHLRALYETPALPAGGGDADRAAARQIIASAGNRTLLSEAESKQVLLAYQIPTPRTVVADTADAAVTAADAIGYPVVVKLHSYTLTHKTDVDGVRLNLPDAPAVRHAFDTIRNSVNERAGREHFLGVSVQPMVRLPDAYELIVGSSVDPQFGPVLLFGAGGQLVEVFRDRALGLPPLNATLARRMIEQTKVLAALKGVRGRKPVPLAELEHLLVRLGQLVLEQPRVREIDINPLLASPEGLLALDARIVLHDASTPEEQLPRPAIRPYPTQYADQWIMTDGTAVTIRPIRPEDEPLVARFHETLSERSVHLRYLHLMKLSTRVAHDRLTRICFNDYDREIALVAEITSAGRPEVIAIVRLRKDPIGSDAEFALIVSDQWQGRGLGAELLRRIRSVARQEGVRRLTADIARENIQMQRLCQRMGMKLTPDTQESVVRAEADVSAIAD